MLGGWAGAAGEAWRRPSAQRRASRRWGARAGLGGVGFQFFEVRDELLFAGPALQVEADHFVGSQRRLAAGPEGQQQAGDDCAIRLNLDARAGRAQQVSAAEHVFEEAEEQFDRPAMPIDIGDDLRRYARNKGSERNGRRNGDEKVTSLILKNGNQ